MTFAELMVVIAVIGVVAAMALPNLGTLSSRKAMLHQADRMGAHLHHARELAVLQGIPWRVVFSPDRAQWLCYGDRNRNALCDPGEQRSGPFSLVRGTAFGCRAGEGPNGSTVPADGISFSGNRVTFSPMGGCNSGTVYLQSPDRSLALRVLPASGTVLIYAHDRSWRLLR